MLTQDQLDILKTPFTPNDVSFVRNFAYGTEDAIADRIEIVDPSWTFERLSIEPRDKYVVATFRLTICGVWRDGVGMEKIDSATEPDKSAATDALKRAARLFGIGRYFQTLPSNVKDYDSYSKWYKASVGTPTLPPAPPAPIPSEHPPGGINPYSSTPAITPATAQNAGKGNMSGNTYRVSNFQVNLTGGRVPQPYLIFSIPEIDDYAYSFTREPFKKAGYAIDDWKSVGNHEMPCPAEIIIEKKVNKDGTIADKWTVKDAKMIDLFVDSQAS